MDYYEEQLIELVLKREEYFTEYVRKFLEQIGAPYTDELCETVKSMISSGVVFRQLYMEMIKIALKYGSEKEPPPEIKERLDKT